MDLTPEEVMNILWVFHKIRSLPEVNRPLIADMATYSHIQRIKQG